MPYLPPDDLLLQKIAVLSIPDAVKALEAVESEAERQRLAGWLARFWRGGVLDVQAARTCVASSSLDAKSKRTLASGLVD